ncbi:MAG: type II toxin-antitoxin system RelE/ParE family toxin [Chloroflexi bacterium]|nr:type II toxin-antitoxin system RelE/ParE family toxin [Chloroflexota bacterium]
MDVRFADPDLDRLETDAGFDAGWPRSVVKAYRKVMGWIWSAVDERDFYNLKGLHFEKLQGRPGQHSMRLNDQYRLIVEFEGSGPARRVIIVEITDYH